MNKEEIKQLIEYRIEADIKAFQGDLPERFAIAWEGYLAGLVEWQVIDWGTYTRLADLIPTKISDPNPILGIFSGREEEVS